MATLQLSATAARPVFVPVERARLSGERAARRQSLQLTRRGRLLLVGVPVVLAVATLLMLLASFSSSAKASVDASTSGALATLSVNVAQGETLWSLAGAYAPERDPRDVVAEIVEYNGLGSSTVHAGQAIEIPVSR